MSLRLNTMKNIPTMKKIESPTEIHFNSRKGQNCTIIKDIREPIHAIINEPSANAAVCRLEVGTNILRSIKLAIMANIAKYKAST